MRCLVDVVLADDLATPTAAGCTGAAPARPEDQREQHADRPDDQQDPADRVDVEPARRDVHGEREHRTDGDQKDADTNAHFRLLSLNGTEGVASVQEKRGNTGLGYGPRRPPGTTGLRVPPDAGPRPRDVGRGSRVPPRPWHADADARLLPPQPLRGLSRGGVCAGQTGLRPVAAHEVELELRAPATT